MSVLHIFLLSINILLYRYATFLFISWSNLGYFYFLTITNNAAINIYLKVIMWTCFYSPAIEFYPLCKLGWFHLSALLMLSFLSFSFYSFSLIYSELAHNLLFFMMFSPTSLWSTLLFSVLVSIEQFSPKFYIGINFWKSIKSCQSIHLQKWGIVSDVHFICLWIKWKYFCFYSH